MRYGAEMGIEALLTAEYGGGTLLSAVAWNIVR